MPRYSLPSSFIRDPLGMGAANPASRAQNPMAQAALTGGMSGGGGVARQRFSSTAARPDSPGSTQSISERAFGGNPGVGSMQPGRTVSFQQKSPPGSSQNRKLLADLQKSMKRQQEAANLAGQQRYEELLKSVAGLQQQVGGTFGEALDAAGGVGDAARRRAQERGTRDFAQAQQGLISRGLGNTTIRESVRRGISSDVERGLQDVDERVAGLRTGILGQRAGAEQQLGRLQADAILSREDVGPNLNTYLNLLQQLAAQGV